MGHIDVFQSAAKLPKIDRLAEKCAEAGNALSPGEWDGERWIDSYEGDVDVRVMLPEPQ
jgi:hypothetical protein